MDNTDYLESLKQKLAKLGYSPYQINKISYDMIGTFGNGNLSPDQYLILVTAMEDYIAVSQKSPRWKARIRETN
jgi:hypothetical protein